MQLGNTSILQSTRNTESFSKKQVKLDLCPATTIPVKGQYLFKIRTSKTRGICDVRMVDAALLRDINNHMDTIAPVPYHETMSGSIYSEFSLHEKMGPFVKNLIRFNPGMCSCLGSIDLHVKRTEHAFNHEDSRYLIEGKNQGNIIDFINNLLQACSDQPLIFCEYSHWTGTKGHAMFLLFRQSEFDRNTYMIELYNPNGPDDDASSYWKTIQNVVDEYDRNSSNPYTLIFTGSVWDTLVEEYIDIRRAFRAFHYEYHYPLIWKVFALFCAYTSFSLSY